MLVVPVLHGGMRSVSKYQCQMMRPLEVAYSWRSSGNPPRCLAVAYCMVGGGVALAKCPDTHPHVTGIIWSHRRQWINTSGRVGVRCARQLQRQPVGTHAVAASQSDISPGGRGDRMPNELRHSTVRWMSCVTRNGDVALFAIGCRVFLTACDWTLSGPTADLQSIVSSSLFPFWC